MIDTIVGQLFQSGAGQDVLRQVQKHGLDEPHARSAVSATVEGALHHTQKSGGMEAEASGLASGAQSASTIASQVAQFVASRTGLGPEIAQKVVSVALPKVLELIQQAAIPSPRPSSEQSFGRH